MKVGARGLPGRRCAASSARRFAGLPARPLPGQRAWVASRRMAGGAAGPDGLRDAVPAPPETPRDAAAPAPPEMPLDVAAAALARSPKGINRRILNAHTTNAVLRVFETDTFDSVNVATALHRVGVLGKTFDASSTPALDRLIKRATKSVVADAWDARLIANATWGLAKLGRGDSAAFFSNVAKAADVSTFSAEDLGKTAWAFATLAKFGTFRDDGFFFKAVVAEASSRVSDFETPDLTNVVWACSTAGVEAPLLYAALADEAPKTLASLKPREWTPLLWSFASAGFTAPEVFRTAEHLICGVVDDLKPHELTNIVWAYAKLGLKAPTLFDAAATATWHKVDRFNAQDIATAVWAYSTAGLDAPLLYKALAHEASKKIARFDSVQLATTVWAFAAAKTRADELLRAVALVAPDKVGSFTPKQLTNTAWAFASVRYAAPELFRAIASEARKKMGEFDAPGLAILSWAFAVAGFDEEELFAEIAAEADIVFDQGGFPALNLSQLHMVHLHLRLALPRHALTRLLNQHASALKTAYQRHGRQSGHMQQQVSAALERIGWKHEYEHTTPEGLSLDMAQPESKLAVEFDGPAHYLYRVDAHSSARFYDGKSFAKNLALRRHGWRVVRVAYFKWRKLRTDAQRDDYLRRRVSHLRSASSEEAAAWKMAEAALSSEDEEDDAEARSEQQRLDNDVPEDYSALAEIDVRDLALRRNVDECGAVADVVQRLRASDDLASGMAAVRQLHARH
ncbi:hypothetical protein M885DRAFT_524656 [Pelagophyceae sp. CCMP2097]|nr:hypothetical protein M885DRAFT_524656 [Pelagophyceae sp. CCMP2097]